MATAFDGLGMGMLGSERQYIKGGGPLSEAAKGLKDFAIVSAIQKSGLQEYLNKMGAKSDQAVPPPQNANAAVNPALPPAPVPLIPETPAPVMQADPLQIQSDKAFGIQSSITPNLFEPRNTAQDQVAMQMQVSEPPTNVGQQQMGKDIPQKSGGIDMGTILSLAKFFI
jgi:hypothetical protein